MISPLHRSTRLSVWDSLVSRHGLRPSVRSKWSYSALIMAFLSLRVSDFKSPLRISSSISVSRNWTVRQRSHCAVVDDDAACGRQRRRSGRQRYWSLLALTTHDTEPRQSVRCHMRPASTNHWLANPTLRPVRRRAAQSAGLAAFPCFRASPSRRGPGNCPEVMPPQRVEALRWIASASAA